MCHRVSNLVSKCRRAPLVWTGVVAFGLFMPAAGFAQTPPTEDGAQSPDDRVEAYLLDRGMLELLARQLEARIQQETVTRDRLAIAERLAGVYSRLLSGATSVEEQRRWESAGERLLARVPEANTIELRLSLARASYTRVERVAEQHALRMIDEEQRTSASVRLADLRGRFVSIGQDADRRVRELEREEERNPRVESEWLRETLEQARRQRSMAFYLAGWSSYYMAELSTDRAEAASAALRHFGWLLGAERNQEATLDGFSIPALQYEHIARAALAVAGCYSMVGRDAVSEQWLDAIEGFDGLPEPVREQIFVRRITHAAQSSSWARAAEIVAKKRDSAIPIAGEFTSDPGKPLPVNHARLLAVLTFETIAREKEHSDPRVERLRDLALGDLVVQDQLGHVLDLAQRYGTDTFGDSTFVSLQVRGLGLYQSARDRQAAAGESSDEPTRDARASELYLRAAELFEHALKARDVERFEVASANTNMLLGLSMFYAGEATLGGEALMLLAADALERAAARFASRERAADALWMAIRSLDQKIADEPELRESQIGVRRDGMVERFLRDYPEDEKAAALILRLAE
ncbi:MAG: hypothetical protein ACNA8P_03735, partial [Phycisphaerales bacterium]